MEKVLRAMDVIPPFDSYREPPSEHQSEVHHVPTPGDVPMERDLGDEAGLAMFSDEGLPSTEDGAEAIPTLDLGEKILAEQRRAVARTRRGPGAAALVPSEFENEAPSELAEPVEIAPDDVAQLQQIVADIVARDIERLCQGLKR
jgi:hypothetical protein